jgi:hypothetical protein
VWEVGHFIDFRITQSVIVAVLSPARYSVAQAKYWSLENSTGVLLVCESQKLRTNKIE